jgi:hypothetical protein
MASRREDDPICVIDPSNRFIGLVIYEGLLKILPINWENGRATIKNNFEVRIRQIDIRTMASINHQNLINPLISTLSHDNNHSVV